MLILDCNPNIVSPPRTPLGPLNTTPSNSGREERTPKEDRELKKVSKRNHRGETPLHCSAIKGNVALVRKLLRMGADPNTQDNAGKNSLNSLKSLNVSKKTPRILKVNPSLVCFSIFKFCEAKQDQIIKEYVKKFKFYIRCIERFLKIPFKRFYINFYPKDGHLFMRLVTGATCLLQSCF